MKIKTVLIFFLTFIGCGKEKSAPSEISDYYEQQHWKLLDDDDDGISNQDEINTGSNPHLVEPPPLSGFYLADLIFSGFLDNSHFATPALKLVVNSTANDKFFFTEISKHNSSTGLPFEDFRFSQEHASIFLEAAPPSILFYKLEPIHNDSFAQLMQNLFINVKGQKINPLYQRIDIKRASFKLAFPPILSVGQWKSITGNLHIGEKNIPWTWNKNKPLQIDFQIEVETKDMLNLMTAQDAARLELISWDYDTPRGTKMFDKKSAKEQIEFFALRSQKSTYGWISDDNNLPANSIVEQPNANNGLAQPWLFFKVQSSDDVSYWLKELSSEDQLWLKDNANLNWNITHSAAPQNNLPLPPHSLIRGLKITGRRSENILQDGSGKKFCGGNSTYRNLATEIVHLDYDRTMTIFSINGHSLHQLLSQDFYITYQLNESERTIHSLSLFWPKDFKWEKFSLRGIDLDKYRISESITLNCGINIMHIPTVYKEKYVQLINNEDFNFEWIL